jgi:hypothetical protein
LITNGAAKLVLAGDGGLQHQCARANRAHRQFRPEGNPWLRRLRRIVWVANHSRASF